jgi:hypothetical protein
VDYVFPKPIKCAFKEKCASIIGAELRANAELKEIGFKALKVQLRAMLQPVNDLTEAVH